MVVNVKGDQSTKRYMKYFCEKTDEISEAFYFLTMLESAVYFICNITPEQLRMSEDLFEKYFSGAVPHHCPLNKGICSFLSISHKLESFLIPFQLYFNMN